MTTPKKIKYFLVSLILAFFVGILAFIVSYNLACLVFPPSFFDESTGEKFETMPIGQALIGSAISFIIGIFTLVKCYKLFSKE